MRTHARQRDSKYLTNQGFTVLCWILPGPNLASSCFFVLIHFQERFQIDAFVMKTLSVLVWTEGLNASRRMRFHRKTHWCWSGLNLIQFCKIIKDYCMVAGWGRANLCTPIKFLHFSFFFQLLSKWPASLRHFSRAVDRFPMAHVKR